MHALTLARATTADLAVVQRLAREIWHRHYPSIIGVDQIEYMLERGYSDEALSRFLRAPGAGLVLAKLDTPVGFAAWHRADEPATTKLDKLYVLHACQRRGVGRRLIDEVVARAREDGASALTLNVNKRNATAIAAYAACGFAVREAVVVDIGGGFVMDDYVMTRPIA
jgi:ribosomal protein S18 acetylase RimI-like enzyme